MMYFHAGPRNNRPNALRREILPQHLGVLSFNTDTWVLIIPIGLLQFPIVAIMAIQATMMAFCPEIYRAMAWS
jgi:hypothetical protein